MRQSEARSRKDMTMHAIFANRWTSIRTRPFAQAVWLTFMPTVAVFLAAMDLPA